MKNIDTQSLKKALMDSFIFGCLKSCNEQDDFVFLESVLNINTFIAVS